MPRTTPLAVKDILGKDYDCTTSPSLQPYIDSASLVTDDIAACATAKGQPYSSNRLRILETWLAAHAYAMADKPFKQRSTLRASGTYESEIGMYLEGTRYGQHAKTLDPLGCLEGLGKKKTVGAWWAGRRPSEQTDVDDRS